MITDDIVMSEMQMSKLLDDNGPAAAFTSRSSDKMYLQDVQLKPVDNIIGGGGVDTTNTITHQITIDESSKTVRVADIVDLDCDIVEDDEQLGSGGIAGRTVTLQMLLAAKILTPGKSTMTIEYLGQKFVGDLLPDGKIKSQETETIFCSPSAWAMHCKRIINPDKKSGCGWASVKYKGKKLDAYKATWLRKCQLMKDSVPSDEEDGDKKAMTPPPPIKRTVLPHNTINNRNIPHDANTLVEAVPFPTLGKIQPFLVTATKSVMLLMDFHCHLTKTEVCGYLAGSWDVNAHNLLITHAFPCCNSKFDREKASETEMQIQKEIVKRKLSLIGWYHSHPNSPALPTLRDCDTQLEYQIKMKGPSDSTYTPCVGFICSPYDDNSTMESTIISYWIVPPPENKPMEYGRPMLMTYTMNADSTPVNDTLKSDMKVLMDYYSKFEKMLVRCNDVYKEDTSYIEKLKYSLYAKFPKEESDDKFWNSIREIFHLEPEENFEKPFATAAITEDKSNEIVDLDSIKSDDAETEKRNQEKAQSLLNITSLQQQLSMPSGLNMNPSILGPSIVVPGPTGTSNFSNTSTTSSSPRDSPITISSNAASPGKFEMPIRASPSPAKSDASSTKTRNSPAPSPGKFSDNPRNNSPNVSIPISSSSHSMYDVTPSAGTAMGSDNMNDFLTASLASLVGKLPPGMQPTELALLFQQKLAEYGVTGFNPVAAAAAITSATKPLPQLPSSTSIIPQSVPPPTITTAPQTSISTPTSSASSASLSSKQTAVINPYKDIDKYDLSYLLQAQYGLTGNYPMPQQPTKSQKSSASKKRNQQQNSYESALLQASLVASHNARDNSHSSGMSSNSSSKHPMSMMDLEDPKLELSKLSEYMKSSEYASLLLQHAAGYGNYGLGSEISISKKSSKKSSAAAAAAAAASAAAFSQADLNSLLQAPSKLPDYPSSMSNKKGGGGGGMGGGLLDYSSLLNQHKLPDITSITPIPSTSSSSSSSMNDQNNLSSLADLSSLFGLSGKKLDGGSASSNDMLNSLFQNVSKSSDLSSLLFAQSAGKMSDLSAYFTAPSSNSSSATATSSKSSIETTTPLLPGMSPLKAQEISSLFQHTKYPGIPDPLAKSTLAANNMYMTPTASLLKMQQEAINAMMMKPPKATTPLSSLSSSSASSSATIVRGGETPPANSSSAPDRPSSKSSSNRGGDSPLVIPPPSSLKYNFSAADLAVSALSATTLPTDFSRKTSATPPVDMSSLGATLTPSPTLQAPPKKRMEFSSIADLAAPPAKMSKHDDSDDSMILNLSNN